MSNSSTVCVFLLLSFVSGLSAASHGQDIFDDSPQARMLFRKADIDNDTYLVGVEFHQVFLNFDLDGNNVVNSTEFVTHWQHENLGEISQGVSLFLNLDVNKDFLIDEHNDMPIIITFFDTNDDDKVSEGEFVIQWAKISS